MRSQHSGGGSGSDIFVINYTSVDEPEGDLPEYTADKTFEELLTAFTDHKTIKAIVDEGMEFQMGYCTEGMGAYLYSILPDASGLLHTYIYHYTNNTITGFERQIVSAGS